MALGRNECTKRTRFEWGRRNREIGLVETILTTTQASPPRRFAPFKEEPGYYYEPTKLWLYGNAFLLDGNLAHLP